MALANSHIREHKFLPPMSRKKVTAKSLPSSPPTPTPSHFTLFAEKMMHNGLPPQLISLFQSYYEEITKNHSGYIPEKNLCPIGKKDLPCINELSPYKEAGYAAAEQFVAIKLNGGLGTSMGMTFAKSLVPVRNEFTFLDVIIQQASCLTEECAPLPLALMNSFATSEDTRNSLRTLDELFSQPICFTQHKFPKVHRQTLMPVTYPQDRSKEWNPSGHGDVYAALVLSGTLQELRNQGKKYALISNADNLGAIFDPRLLGYMKTHNIPFLMEVAPRTPSDKKGGHLARHKEGGLILRELAQCHANDIDHFQDITRYGLFNTNNIWIDLDALHTHVQRHGLLRLPIILNPKQVDPNDPSSTPVYQVETAMGAAISSFSGAQAVVIERDRFIPVKKCCDLLATMSDCYIINENTHLTPNPDRNLPPIYIELDETYYKTYGQLIERFPQGAPSLLNCRSLRVSGDIIFSSGIICAGDVHIINKTPYRVVLPNDLVLQGTICIQ